MRIHTTQCIERELPGRAVVGARGTTRIRGTGYLGGLSSYRPYTRP